MFHSRERNEGTTCGSLGKVLGCYLDHSKSWKSSQGWTDNMPSSSGDAEQQGRLTGNSSVRLAVPREMKAQKWQSRFQSVCVWDDGMKLCGKRPRDVSGKSNPEWG